MRRYLPLLIFTLLALMLAYRLTMPRVAGTIDSPLIGKSLPDLGIAELPKGPFIVNFFASWCAPCTIEHPTLMQFEKDGITIIGIAFNDTPENITAWLKKRGNPYKSVIYDAGDGPSVDMGITGVPESFVVDAQGIVRKRFQGPLEDPSVIAEFEAAVNP